MPRAEPAQYAPRPGVVLILALIALLAFELIATGFLFVATQETVVAEAWVRHVRTRAAAESALRLASAQWRASAHRELAVGERVQLLAGVTADGVDYAVDAERMAAARVLLLSRAAIAPAGHQGGAAATAAVRVRALEADALFAGLTAAITTHAPLTLADGVIVDPTDPAAAECAERLPGAQAAVVADSLSQVDGAGAILGEPGLATGDTVAGVPGPLGPLSWEAIAQAAQLEAEGEILLQHAVQNGECLTAAPANWGSPLDPGGPCGTYYPLIFAPGDLTVTGGAGQGVLVVRGNLTLQEGVRFHGAIIVGGALDAGNALIDGALRIGADGQGAVSELSGGAVRYRRCALLDALEGSALDGAFRSGPRLWLPAFE